MKRNLTIESIQKPKRVVMTEERMTKQFVFNKGNRRDDALSTSL